MTTMDDDELDKLAKDIAKNADLVAFHLNTKRLAIALKRAITEYDGDNRMWQRRKSGAKIIKSLREIAAALRRSQKRWDALGPDAKTLVAEFVSDTYPPAEIDDRFTFVVELFEEFAKHHTADRGNPGTARIGAKKNLKPLRDFVRVLMNFWTEETGKPFGHHVEDAEDVGGRIRLAGSPAMEFLDHASSALGGFHVGSLETVVRSIKAEGNGD